VLSRKPAKYIKKTRDRHKLDFGKEVFGKKRRREPREGGNL